MITLEELKKIEESPFYETFRQSITKLTEDLFVLYSDSYMYKNGDNSISLEDMEDLNYYRQDLRRLIYGESDEEKQAALERLKEFPNFLAKPAFPNQANPPSILKRMFEVASENHVLGYEKLEKDLGRVVKCIELDLGPQLSVQKLGTEREAWNRPAAASAPKFPDRDQAQPNSWAGLFYKLTGKSDKPNLCKDVSVYEHKCSDNSFRRLAALRHMVDGSGAKEVPSRQALDREAALLRQNPLSAMTLRNEHTVEMLRRGDILGVTERLAQTKKDFSFRSMRELKEAKQRAARIQAKMNKMEGKTASSPEFQALKDALKAFREADYTKKEEAAQRSADVLTAVENFTKGRKNVQRSARAQECVNLALDALVSLVPDAAANPHVSPLIERFNQVRSSKNRISLSEFGAGRNYTVEDAVKEMGKDINDFNLTLVRSAAEAVSALHNGKIDPVSFGQTVEVLLRNRFNLTTLAEGLKSDQQSCKKAAASLLEGMAEDQKLVKKYTEMDAAEMKKELQTRAEQLSAPRLQPLAQQ